MSAITEPRIYSVSKINSYIKATLENDFVLNSVWVTGEISNFKYHSSGNMFFSLKDNDSAISCIMFKGDAYALPFMPENGMNVVICGYVSVYEKSGQYPAGTVFIEGLVFHNQKWFLYYGCADSRVAVAVYDPLKK
ncbi:MAG: hypothetical protein EGQ35_08980 [Clostridiales bacterium]|nr:hypothetical protein [Clostridiales bacterium]